MLVETQDALKTMATAFTTMASQVNGVSAPQAMTNCKENASKQVTVYSSNDELGSDDAYSQDQAWGKANHASNKRTGSKWYYAVACGRKPGVYTDWGWAEKQVNGFPVAVHKKF